jgi:hypothetical protein
VEKAGQSFHSCWQSFSAAAPTAASPILPALNLPASANDRYCSTSIEAVSNEKADTRGVSAFLKKFRLQKEIY